MNHSTKELVHHEEDIYDYLRNYHYFTMEELDLVLDTWGLSLDTFDKIITTRYGLSVEQLILEEKEIPRAFEWLKEESEDEEEEEIWFPQYILG